MSFFCACRIIRNSQDLSSHLEKIKVITGKEF